MLQSFFNMSKIYLESHHKIYLNSYSGYTCIRAKRCFPGDSDCLAPCNIFRYM